jgi:hypothetical protein
MTEQRRLSRSLIERQGLDDADPLSLSARNIVGSKIFGHLLLNGGELPRSDEDKDALVAWANRDLFNNNMPMEATRAMLETIIEEDFQS